MTRYDQASGSCHVYTFKEGLLSAVAHDLKIRVDRWAITVSDDGGTVEATFDPTSLTVECAMKDQREAAGALAERDKRKIADNIRKDVLKSKRHNEIRFSATQVDAAGDGYELSGALTLAGKTRDIRASVRREGDELTTTVRLHQPDFGIKPFSAMLGTLKIQPQVEVRIRVPAPA